MNGKDKNAGFGIAGMVCGIVGLVLACVVVGIVPAAVGLILSIIGAAKCRNKGMSIAGIILSSLAIMLFAFILIIGVAHDDTPEKGKGEVKLPKQQQEETKENKPRDESETPKPEQSESPKESEPVAESKEEFIASCQEYEYKTLARTPDDYIGKRVVLTIKIEQKVSGTWLDNKDYYRAYTNNDVDLWYGDEYVICDTRQEDDSKILKSDIIKVYGEFAGMQTVTRAISDIDEEVPQINAYYIELIQE